IGTPDACAAVRNFLAKQLDAAVEEPEQASVEHLSDASSVQLCAVRSITATRDPHAAALLTHIVQTGEPALRREAATALGRIGNRETIPARLASLKDAQDRVLEHALIYALIEIDGREETLAGLSAEAPQVRRGALTALDQMPSGDLTRALVS